MMTLDEILPLLKGVKRSGDGWVAHCPGHDDQTQSLSVGAGASGKLLLRCHARCPFASFLAVLRSLAAPNGHAPDRARLVALYDYCDARGTLLYQVARYDPKGFRCRRPDGRDGWTWNLNGTPPVPYRLPE